MCQGNFTLNHETCDPDEQRLTSLMSNIGVNWAIISRMHTIMQQMFGVFQG